MHPLRVDPTNTVTPEELEAERAGEQELIDEGLSLPSLLPIVPLLTLTIRPPAEPLTAEEEAEKESLAGTGFDWNKREYQGFIRGCEMHGRYVLPLSSSSHRTDAACL